MAEQVPVWTTTNGEGVFPHIFCNGVSHNAQYIKDCLNAGETAKAEASRLLTACSKQQDEIQQILGKAIGYPRYCDDPKNFPNSTPDDGVCVGDHTAESIASEAAELITGLRSVNQRLRAELAEAKAEVDRLSISAGLVARLEAENERLKNGDFAPEEFQNLCHKEPPLSFCDFVNGCREYQRKLFGKSDHDEAKGEIDRLRAELAEAKATSERWREMCQKLTKSSELAETYIKKAREEIERLLAELAEARSKVVDLAIDIADAKTELAALKETLDSTEASHDDEEAAHQDTLRLLGLRDAELAEAKAAPPGLAEALTELNAKVLARRDKLVSLGRGVAAKELLEISRTIDAMIARPATPAPPGLVERLRKWRKEVNTSFFPVESARDIRRILDGIDVILADFAPKPKVEWVESKDAWGNSRWTTDGAVVVTAVKNNRLGYLIFGMDRLFATLDEAKAAVEAKLTPPAPLVVRRWVSRDYDSAFVYVRSSEPEKDNGRWYVKPPATMFSSYANDFTSLTGITVGEGECVEVEFTPGFCRVV